MVFFLERLFAQTQLITFTPFYNSLNCNNAINGVGFGSKQFQCSLNFTDSISFMVYNIYNTQEYNLTYHGDVYCDDYLHYEMYTMDECTYSDYSGSSYLLGEAYQWSDVKVPANSILYQTLDNICENVQSYWYATNGTTIQDKHAPWGSTQYYCQQGKAYSRYCSPNGPCITNQMMLDDCSSSSPFKIICT
ncbi:hypothetical protein PPL_07169 [Heterostelium album PN500]|uniref:Uncharacterized protein n=1 Tax=Heterostelium pallidum (strain ATCC 26659 / Pp 5 / PN500) TaxID=670386 RepID=D3BEK5_HETP5|nr:hypothetical protein PPL_07169 [Heterostelium album PN500]EFA80336.1 hypothetical protein PPL_07169 [Heterostelium album PN500]|eukprot:XP_020432456.1 hypothetical protein PPL_07169 [Heterostelium album PN500]